MDDFLHNLRSGKLKQPDRSNRSYSDPQYKGGKRRNDMDRRKKEFDAFERLNAVKEVLETISETQKRMAHAYEARTKAEERKARAMEILAKNLYRMLNPQAQDVDKLFAPEPAMEIGPAYQEDPDAGEMEQPAAAAEQEASQDQPDQQAQQDQEDQEAQQDQEDQAQTHKLSEIERQRLFVIIDRMRIAGDKWEKIARHIASEGYPTVSGKGNWRGIMAKTLYEKMLSE